MLSQFLTFKAVACPWNSVEPFRFDVIAALDTLAERPLPHVFKSLGQVSQRLTCDRSFVRESLSFILSRNLISGIGMPCGICSYLLLCIRCSASAMACSVSAMRASRTCLKCSIFFVDSKLLTSRPPVRRERSASRRLSVTCERGGPR